jgi:hypothetical protein
VELEEGPGRKENDGRGRKEAEGQGRREEDGGGRGDEERGRGNIAEWLERSERDLRYQVRRSL